MDLVVGAHVPIAGGLQTAVTRSEELGLKAFQMFTRSPRGWQYAPLNREEIIQFKALRDNKFASVNSHMPYLTNFASHNDVIYRRSIESLKEELRRAELLELNHVVLHVGSHMGKGLESGKSRVVNAIKSALDEVSCKCNVLLENMAGQANSVGSKFQDLGEMLELINDDRVGVCFDTCHAYAAGYDLVTQTGFKLVMRELNKHIGLERIKLVHLNDSKSKLGGGLDRHERIGRGFIGVKGFKTILLSEELTKKPLILETPVNDYHDYLHEIQTINKIVSGD